MDNEVCARQGSVLAAAASNKDASGDVAMGGEVDGISHIVILSHHGSITFC